MSDAYSILSARSHISSVTDFVSILYLESTDHA